MDNQVAKKKQNTILAVYFQFNMKKSPSSQSKQKSVNFSGETKYRRHRIEPLSFNSPHESTGITSASPNGIQRKIEKLEDMIVA